MIYKAKLKHKCVSGNGSENLRVGLKKNLKNNNFMHFERHPSKMHKIIFIPPANFVCDGYTVFTLSMRPCVRASVRNVLFP